MSDRQAKKSPAASKKKEEGPARPGTSSKKSGSSAGATADQAAAAEEGRRQLRALQTQVEVSTAQLKVQDAAVQQLQHELAVLRLRHSKDTATSTDVLQHQQREMVQAQQAVRRLEVQLAEALQETEGLQRALQAAQTEAAAAAARAAGQEEQEGATELQRMQSRSRHQDECLAAKDSELSSLRQRLERTEQALAAERSTVAGLEVKAQSRSELRFFRGSPWLVHVARQRLTGTAPACGAPASGATLAVVGRQLVVEAPAGPHSRGQGQQRQLHTLDLGSGAWRASSVGPDPAALPPVTGRAVCSIGSKLLGFGGRCQDGLLPSSTSTQFLLPDLGAWLPAPAPADALVQQPPPRHSAALAYCARSQAAYLYGGQGEDGSGSCLGDLWKLDVRTLQWSRLDEAGSSDQPPTAAVHHKDEPPQPCSGAGLAVSPDGSRLWLMGGRLDSGRCSSALHWYDLTNHRWVAAAIKHERSCPIEPRAEPAITCVGRHIIVAGGVSYAASGQVVQRRDCAVFDTADGVWDVIDSTPIKLVVPTSMGSSEPKAVTADLHSRATPGSASGVRKLSRQASAESTGAPLHAGTCVFAGSKLLLLKPPGGTYTGSSCQMSELWTVDLVLPEAIDLQRQAKHAATVVTELVLKQEAVASTSVRLSWCAPPTNRDKLKLFKLMVTNMEGRAREAYEGAETCCEVCGLQPASQYIFCLKALYDDASFLWSEPQMVTTNSRPAKLRATSAAAVVAEQWK